MSRFFSMRYITFMTYTLKTAQFEGPFDTLLDLIEREKLSINEIALAHVADGFFQYVKTEAVAHEEFAAFLVVASTLMLIKSRSLLPGFHITKEEEKNIQELEERLEIYKRIRAFAAMLGERIAERKRMFSRPAFAEERPAFIPPSFLSLDDLKKALDQIVVRMPKPEELPQTRVGRVVSLEEVIAAIESRMQGALETTFQQMIDPRNLPAGRHGLSVVGREKIDIIMNFLALLELLKRGVVHIEQKMPFGAMVVRNAE